MTDWWSGIDLRPIMGKARPKSVDELLGLAANLSNPTNRTYLDLYDRYLADWSAGSPRKDEIWLSWQLLRTRQFTDRKRKEEWLAYLKSGYQPFYNRLGELKEQEHSEPTAARGAAEWLASGSQGWVTRSVKPLLQKNRLGQTPSVPRSVAGLLEVDSGSEVGRTLLDLYRSWLGVSKVAGMTADDLVRAWDALVAGAYDGTSAAGWTEYLNRGYRIFLGELTAVLREMQKSLADDPRAAETLALGNRVALVKGTDQALMAQAWGLLEKAKRELVIRVKSTVQNYAEAGRQVEEDSGEPAFPPAQRAIDAIDTAHQAYQSAEARLRAYLSSLDRSSKLTAGNKAELLDQLLAFCDGCRMLADGLYQAAKLVKSWAESSTKKKLKAGFQAEYPYVWAAFQTTKIAVGVVNTVLQFAGPAAAITAPTLGAVGVLVSLTEKVVVEVVTTVDSKDRDIVESGSATTTRPGSGRPPGASPRRSKASSMMP